MKKLIVTSLTNVMLFGSLLGIIIYSYTKIGAEKTYFPPVKINTPITYENASHMYQLLKKEMIHELISSKKIHSPLHIKHKFIPSIKLNSYQALAYHKTDPEKTKLLHSILNNTQQRNKFKYIMKKAEELKLPNELALIPVIESEYKNKAVSPKGAGGLWQLMPGTARIFGLSNRQRFEMAASTKVALLHFKDLYNEYKNWELAIAAYNAGDGAVNKALHRNPHAKTVQELKLPRETRKYVLSFFQLQKALKSYNLT